MGDERVDDSNELGSPFRKVDCFVGMSLMDELVVWRARSYNLEDLEVAETELSETIRWHLNHRLGSEYSLAREVVSRHTAY